MIMISTVACNAMEIQIDSKSVYRSDSLGNMTLHHNKNGFFAKKDGQEILISSAFVDSDVRSIKTEKLKDIQKDMYFRLSQMNDGELTLKANSRLRGGGPLFGLGAYWITKTVAYGTALVGAGAVAIPAVPVAGAAVSTLVSAATLGASPAVALTGAAIGGSGLVATETAATATVIMVTAPGGIAGAIACVEGAASAVGAFFAAIPFLP